ncbi:hypothetical protein H6G81_17825 [Scytonema hofmannii FACHB-248]|uniref:Uncharacterized protein n=1 Tax=Scytonema hofmannii FACHB-248 TaxID=1842502 RepID=A0ABR8GTD7_9CYAN|nr:MULTISPECIES: hypothetical protein [Nostocales]MBD2606339.1 hypothetical protein [Scytonema hofmannii FACHB-248]
MTLNSSLELDNRTEGGILEDLEKILQALQDFKVKNPQILQHLCQSAIATGEMSLGDAESALDWASNYVAEGGN